MAYKQKPGRGNLPKTGRSIPLSMKSPNLQVVSAGDLNKALYEAEKFSKSIENDPLGKSQSSSIELPTFRYRGKEAFEKSLKDGDYIQPSFTDQGDNSKYKYLSSRFNINPDIKDPMARTQMRQQDIYNRDRATTISEDAKTLQDAIIKRSYRGVDETLKEAEQGAKVSANISKNLQSAKSTGNESELKSAIEQARSNMRANKFLRSTRPVIKNPRTGKTVISDQAAYANARMVQDYIEQSQEATKKQNIADKLRFLKEDFEKEMTNRKPFSVNKFNERSGN